MRIRTWLLGVAVGIGLTLLTGCGGKDEGEPVTDGDTSDTSENADTLERTEGGEGDYDCNLAAIEIEANGNSGACSQNGLIYCNSNHPCYCGGLTCYEGKWAWSEWLVVDISCELWHSCNCRAYTLDGDEEGCAGG